LSLASDRAEIQESLFLYLQGVDSADMKLMAQAFWPDATDDHAHFYGGTIADIIPTMETMRARFHVMQSALSNISIEVNGDEANSEAVVIAHHRYMFDGAEYEWLTLGRYIDRHEKREGVWKIAHRASKLDSERVSRIEQAEPPADLLKV
jgi:hypothetical protein